MEYLQESITVVCLFVYTQLCMMYVKWLLTIFEGTYSSPNRKCVSETQGIGSGRFLFPVVSTLSLQRLYLK